METTMAPSHSKGKEEVADEEEFEEEREVGERVSPTRLEGSSSSKSAQLIAENLRRG